MAIRKFFGKLQRKIAKKADSKKSLKELEKAREQNARVLAHIEGLRSTAKSIKLMRDKTIVEALPKVRAIASRMRKGQVSRLEARKMVDFIEDVVKNAKLKNSELEMWGNSIIRYYKRISHPDIKANVEKESARIDFSSCEIRPDGTRGLSYDQAIAYMESVKGKLNRLLHN